MPFMIRGPFDLRLRQSFWIFVVVLWTAKESQTSSTSSGSRRPKNSSKFNCKDSFRNLKMYKFILLDTWYNIYKNLLDRICRDMYHFRNKRVTYSKTPHKEFRLPVQLLSPIQDFYFWHYQRTAKISLPSSSPSKCHWSSPAVNTKLYYAAECMLKKQIFKPLIWRTQEALEKFSPKDEICLQTCSLNFTGIRAYSNNVCNESTPTRYVWRFPFAFPGLTCKTGKQRMNVEDGLTLW